MMVLMLRYSSTIIHTLLCDAKNCTVFTGITAVKDQAVLHQGMEPANIDKRFH